MKKLVLSVFTFAVAFSANAQNCVTGYKPTVIYSDFSYDTDPGNADKTGLYAWGADQPAKGFKCALTRDASAGVLKAVISQAYAEYIPFGISFGDDKGDGTGVPFTADFSGDATFEVKVSNKSTTTDIRFRMALQDVNDVNADTKASGKDNVDKIWEDIIEQTVLAGETVVFKGTYAGGGQALYTDPKQFVPVDITKIKAVLFTIINKATTADQGDAFADLPLEIDYLRVGACTISGINSNSDVVSSNVYPNPTSDVANVSLDLKEVSNVKVALMDIFGKEVKVVTEGKFSSVNQQVNVSDLAKGVYTVAYIVNGANVKSKLLMVK